MAKFTLTNDKTEVREATMHVGGSKRLHLAGVGGDKKVLQLDSSSPAAVTPTLVALFDGPKGIWTVKLSAKAKGKAEIQAKVKGAAVAKVAVTVVEKLVLPAASGEEGMLVRLFLAENLSPDQTGYDAAKSKTAMQWMRLVLANRLKNNPAQFGAPKATTITDIVKAPGQFAGFEKYPTLAADVSARIDAIVSIVNDDSDARQDRYAQFVQTAMDVAKSTTPVPDPCSTGLYGWRTAGSGSPGPRFVKYGHPLSGNQFYTLKK